MSGFSCLIKTLALIKNDKILNRLLDNGKEKEQPFSDANCTNREKQSYTQFLFVAL